MMRLIYLLILSLLSWQISAAQLTASVDRTRLSEGESVELTLSLDDPTLFSKPDLSPLNADFELLRSRQENNLSSINGQTRASTTWFISLLPKRTGNLTIPELTLGELRSNAIQLEVLEGQAGSDGKNLAPVFIEASLDHDSVYVQAQAVLTLRIYHSVSLYNDSSLTPLQMDDARVEQLGNPRTYEKDINGVRHGVIEVNYAIFPQKSGAMLIPSLQFSATLADRSNGSSFRSFGTPSRVSSAKIPMQVKAKPASYPADTPWLPARAISLNEAWNPEPESLQVGDSVTRSLLIKADGLSAAQLPPLPLANIAGLRRYPEQAQLSGQASDTGVIGSREEREALVPTRSGQIELPEIKITWWNTVEDRLVHTSLPAHSLSVAANPMLDTGIAPVTEVSAPAVQSQSLWPWQLSSGLLLCTSLLGFGLWWRARGQPAIVATVQTGPSPRTLLDDLRKACLANDPQQTRQALDAWARQQPESLAAMAERFAPLSSALDGLNEALYSTTELSWEGAELWRGVRNLPAAETVSDMAETSALPPLYPR